MEFDDQKFERLRKLCYNSALQITHSPEDAEDIAQDVLMSIIRQDDIDKAEQWLKRVVTNKSIDYLRKRNKNVILDDSALVVEDKTEANDDLPSMSKVKIRKMLSKEDYDVYLDYLKAENSIKKFADANQLSYNQARRKVDVMKRNLKSRFLYQNDYRTELTLNYNEWESIYKFLYKYIQCSSKGRFDDIRNYFKHARNEVYVQVDKYDSFSIFREKENNLISMLFVGLSGDNPIFLCFDLIFIKNNLRILDSYLPAFVIEISDDEIPFLVDENSKINDYYTDSLTVEEITGILQKIRSEKQ